jgi:hypothetical protein
MQGCIDQHGVIPIPEASSKMLVSFNNSYSQLFSAALNQFIKALHGADRCVLLSYISACNPLWATGVSAPFTVVLCGEAEWYRGSIVPDRKFLFEVIYKFT